MTSPTTRPTFSLHEFEYCELSSTHFGRLLVENGVDVQEINSRLRILDKKSANVVWKLIYGDVPHRFHKNAKDRTWRNELNLEVGGDWLPYFGTCESPPVEQQLRQLMNWPDEQLVLFLPDGGTGVIATWKFVVENWKSFVEYNDDASDLLQLDGQDVLTICPNGNFIRHFPNKIP